MTRITIEATSTLEKIPVERRIDKDTLDAMVARSFEGMNNDSLSSVEQAVNKSDYIHWKTLQDDEFLNTITSLKSDLESIAPPAAPKGKSFTLTKDPSFKLTAEHDESPEA